MHGAYERCLNIAYAAGFSGVAYTHEGAQRALGNTPEYRNIPPLRVRGGYW